jgi:hypothetical protein
VVNYIGGGNQRTHRKPPTCHTFKKFPVPINWSDHDRMVVGFTTTYAISAYYDMLWVWISIRARCTTLYDTVCQWLVTGRWFSMGPRTVWLLYYCLIKYCLKHCVCFYQVAIPQEILKIVSMFVVHVSSFILTWRIIRIVTIFIFGVFTCEVCFKWYRCFHWLLFTPSSKQRKCSLIVLSSHHEKHVKCNDL